MSHSSRNIVIHSLSSKFQYLFQKRGPGATGVFIRTYAFITHTTSNLPNSLIPNALVINYLIRSTGITDVELGTFLLRFRSYKGSKYSREIIHVSLLVKPISRTTVQ